MKTLYLECGMGAAGDMLTAALLELAPDRQAFIDKMNALGIPGVRVDAEPAVKCGVTGTHMRVTVNGEEEESVDVLDGGDHDHDHDHDHGGDHDHGDDHGHGHHHGHDHEHDHGHGHHHDHDHDDGHGHHHDHDHDDDHEHDHGHDDDHDHGHHHDHDHDHDHDHGHHHSHTSVSDINALIDRLPVSDGVKGHAKAVYALIADAESRVHDRPMDEVHFHEVGSMDAVADVVGVCLLMEEIAPDRVTSSPVHTGSGYVRCAHGVLPVPAPATALILTGVPSYGGDVKGELCTPTGAALIRHFASSFGPRPVMAVKAVGYGMGKKDFERANCVRAFLGEEEPRTADVVRLECNLDDMTGEDIAFAEERLFAEGAFDVYTVPIGMKKSRPGVLLCAICAPEDADRLAEAFMRHTTTLGVRRLDMSRYILDRQVSPVETPYGTVRVKRAQGMGAQKEKPEFEDLAALAREKGLSLYEVRRALEKG